MDVNNNPAPKNNRVNKHGLATSKINHKLKVLQNNTQYYRPKEIARDLVKLAHSIDPQVTITTAQKLNIDSANCGS